MNNFKITHFTEQDILEIANVMRQAFNSVDQGWDEASSIAYIKSCFDYAFNRVLVQEGRIVGFIVADRKDTNLFIDAIGVLPEHMNQGIAKALWNEAVRYAKQENLAGIRMIADPSSAAYQWYLRLGLKDTGWVEMEVKLGTL